MWVEEGVEIPGLSQRDKNKLVANPRYAQELKNVQDMINQSWPILRATPPNSKPTIYEKEADDVKKQNAINYERKNYK
jgi:hypothetical protein